MTTTIGRAVFQNALSAGPQWDGDTLTLRINIHASTPEAARALLQQVQGLANNADEPVVPVISTDEPTLDGYYTVLGANVEPSRIYKFGTPIPCTIGLQRVAGSFALAQTEQITAAVTRTNFDSVAGSAITTASPVGTGSTRTTTTGDILITTQTPTAAPFTRTYYLSPSEFYIGACTVEFFSGGAWYVQAGRQAPAAASTPWRISNGFVRFTPGTNGVIEVWNGSAWEASANLRWAPNGTIGSDFAVTMPSIMRNAPECVVVRTAFQTAKVGRTVDFLIRRGAAHIEITDSAGSGVGFAASTASTAIGTHALHQTADDANGNRIVLGAAFAGLSNHSINTTTGAAWVGGLPSNLLIGVNFGGVGAASHDTPTAIRNQWLGIGPAKQRVVTR